MIGCYLYDDCKLQPQITPDYLISDYIISSNHLYAFAILSLIGVFTYKNSKKIRIPEILIDIKNDVRIASKNKSKFLISFLLKKIFEILIM